MSHILSIIELHAALEEEKLAHQFAEKELAELKRDLLMQRDATKSQLDWGNQMQAERDALKARVAQLEKALRWYGEERNYRLSDPYRELTWIEDDCGARARAALEVK